MAPLDVSGSNDAADFQKGGMGGSVSILTLSSAPFTLGGTAGTVGLNGIVGTLSANGGAGASFNGQGGSIAVTNLGTGGVKFLAAGALTVSAVNATSQALGGDGGSIQLIAPKGAVFVMGGLDASGGTEFIGAGDPYAGLVLPPGNNSPPYPAATSYSAGFGGSIKIVSGSSVIFNVGAGTTNGTTGALTANGWSGGSITVVNNLGGITVGSGMLTVNASNAIGNAFFIGNERYLGGPGGSITLIAPVGNVVINGGLSANGGLFATTSRPDYFQGGPGGSITIISGSSVPFTLGPSPGLNGSAGALTATGQDGGVITITNVKSGGIRITDNTLISVKAVDGTGTTAPSGYLINSGPPANEINAINFPGSGFGGNGGKIFLNATGANGNVFISAASSTSPSLNVDGGAGDFSNGNGLSGVGGTISITTNSSLPFLLGTAVAAPTANGTVGTLSADGFSGGTIAVTNLGTGGVTFKPTSVSVAANDIASNSGGSAGNISLQAPLGTLANTAAGTLSADAVSGTNASGGTIALSAKVINTSKGILVLSANADQTSAGSCIGGSVFITQTQNIVTSPLVLGNSSSLRVSVEGLFSTSGGNIFVTSPGGISVQGVLTTDAFSASESGTITLDTSGGAGNIITTSFANPINTGLLTLRANTGSIGYLIIVSVSPPLTIPVPLAMNVGEVVATSNGGDILLNNSSFPLQVNGISQLNKGNVAVSAGPLTIAGPITSPGNVSLSSATGSPADLIDIYAPITAKTMNLSALGDGSAGGGISLNFGLIPAILAADSITLFAGVDGLQNIVTSTGALTLNVIGNPATTNVDIINLGNVVVSMGSSADINTLSIGALGTLTVGPITQAQNLIIGNLSVGNTIMTGSVGAGTNTSSVSIFSTGSIVQSGAGSVVQANSISLGTNGGNIGTTASPLNINVIANGLTPGILVLDTTGGLNTTAGGVVLVNSSSSVNVTSAQVGGNLQLSSNGSITLSGTLAATQGSMTFVNTNTTTGDITVSVNASVTAGGGPLVLQNSNLNGLINVGTGVTLSGNGLILDFNNIVLQQTGVALISGAFPGSPVVGTAPSGAVPVQTPPFQIFYGSNSFNNAVGPVNINATGANVVFNGNSSSTITVGDNTTITAGATIQGLSSLDLTNSAITAAIVSLQGQAGSGVTGALIVSGGKATGGNVIFGQDSNGNYFNLQNLAGLNVPANVTVQFSNYNEAAGVTVTTPSTATVNALVAGSVNFVGVNQFSSYGQLQVLSALPGQVLTINPGAQLTSDGGLDLFVGGSATINGNITAQQDMIFSTFAGIGVGSTGPSINNPGSITLNGNLTAVSDAMEIYSTGSVLQTKGLISAPVGLTIVIGGVNTGFKTSTLSLNAVKTDDFFLEIGTNASASIVGTTTNLNIKSLFVVDVHSKLTVSQTSAIEISGLSLDPMNITAPEISIGSDGLQGSGTFTTNKFTNLSDFETIGLHDSISIVSSGKLPLTIVGTDDISTGHMHAANGIKINSPSVDLKIIGGDYLTDRGAITITAKTSASIDNAFIAAGLLDSGYPPGYTVDPNFIDAVGSVSITGGTSLTVTGGSFIQSVGANVGLGALKGNLAVNASTLEADGGSVFMTASGKITGNGLTVTANAVGTTPNNVTGGGIFINAGVTAPPPVGLSATAPGQLPFSPLFLQPDNNLSPLGSNVLITNTTGFGGFIPVGSVTQNLGATGSVNLGASADLPTFVFITGGSMILGSPSSAATITIESGTFSTNSLKPIAYTTAIAPGSEEMFDHQLVADESAAADGLEPIAHVMAPGQAGTRVMAVKANGGKSPIHLKKHDEMVLRTMRDVTLQSHLATVHAKKGALVSVSVEHHGLRVAALSGPGHVKVVAGGRSMAMHPGQEIVISSHALAPEEQGRADGVGRRRFQTCSIGEGLHASTCDFSLVSYMANVGHMRCIKHPRTAIEKRIASDLMTTAAALSIVTDKLGAYTARPVENRTEASDSEFSPVGYNH